MATDIAVTDHTQRAHSAVLGGSSAGRVLQCAGSVLLAQTFPNRETEFAAEGTAFHMALDMIFSGVAKHDRDVIGLTFNGYEITEDMYEEGIAPILDWFDALDKELGGIEYLSEQRVTFPYIEGSFGTTDLIGTAKDRSILIDFKLGRGVAVSAEDNPQGKYYGVSAMHTEATKKFFADDKPVEIFIAQPRVNDGEPFTRWMTTTRQLEAYGIELKQAVERGLEPGAAFQMGPYCKFCPAKVGCPEFNRMARPTLEMTREQLVEKLDELLPYADGFIALGKEIKDLAHFELERGGKVNGWKLVGNKKTRSWIDEDKARRWFAKVGIPAAERDVKKMISPKGAEDALKRNHLNVELPKALVKAESTGTTLAPESDKRPAVAAAGGALKMLAASLAARS